MSDAKYVSPVDDPQQLANTLREQGASPADVEDLAAALTQLSKWAAPAPTPEETRQLLEHLVPALPKASIIRRDLRAQRRSMLGEFWLMLRLVQTQLSILQPSFWFASALIVFVGVLFMLGSPSSTATLVLEVIGPLLAYLGTASAFRSAAQHVLEFELACPPSPRQLTLARLIIILCYDILLGYLLTLPLRPVDSLSFGVITLHWLAPLLLAVGVTLLLSLRLPSGQAAAITYTGWLTMLMLSLSGESGLRGAAAGFSSLAELGFGLLGLALMGIVLIYMPKAVPRWLPRS